MAKVDISVAWLSGDRARAAPLLLELLQAIREQGSIQKASASLGISYRNAWGLLESWRTELGRPLIEKTRGRGTRLTALGEALLRCDDQARAALAPQLARLRDRFDRELGLSSGSAATLTLCASHDLALAAVRDALERSGVLRIDLQFRGSIDSIEAMVADRCELAGFHVDAEADGEVVAPYHRLLNARRHAIVRFAERRQGLMLRPADQPRIGALADLVDGPRFVNRQPGSGTRLLFDRLLRAAKLDQRRIAGYGREEFTHLAVGATVAAGHADVGFGIEAAAAQFDLAFVPLAGEHYCLALRRDRLRDGRVLALLDYLGSAVCRALIESLPGYRATGSGEVGSVDQAFPAASSATPGVAARRGG
ncbi:MAG TPA: substrate-binding domain-containing protein [Casimicrobiaceae bacterium]|nr:substrate-binding domain-containing protein [Casimicrobiaceae bacterium]